MYPFLLRDLLGYQENKEILVFLGLKETEGRWDQLVQKVRQEIKAYQDQRDQLDHEAPQDLLEMLDLLVYLESLDPQVDPDLLDHLV